MRATTRAERTERASSLGKTTGTENPSMTMVRFERVNHHMTRVVPAVSLLAGAAVLVAWWATPATSAPPQRPAPVVTEIDQILPVVADVTAQVDRLRQRLTDKPAVPVPARDPFRFSSSRSTPTPRASVAPIVAPPPENVAPSVPRLV